MNLKKNHVRILALATLAFVLAAFALPALAAPPTQGTVVEGVSVPGLDLGSSRAEVEAAFGAPSYCQSITAGDYASCTYSLGAQGTVSVRYRGADGGNAQASGADVAYVIYWYGLSEWVTTAGVTTDLALADPQTVIAAYPNADLTYTSSGTIYQLRDGALGIQVNWFFNPYSGTTSLQMAVFLPAGGPSPTPTATTPPPPTPTPTPTPEPQNPALRVSQINLSLDRRGRVNAQVEVVDEQGAALRNAVVDAQWTFPNGQTQPVQGQTSRSGSVNFRAPNLGKGVYTLTILSASRSGYDFDAAGSLLSASLTR